MFFEKRLIGVIFRMASPVVLGMIARTLMNIVDTAMVGHLGPSAVAASGLCGLILWIIMSVFLAVSTAVQAIVSRRFGEGAIPACGTVLNTTLIAGSGIGGVIAWLGFSYGDLVIPLLNDDPAVIAYGGEYLRVRFLENFSFLLLMIFRGFFNGIGHTSVFMVVMLISNALNIFLNYALIFGHWGFPRLEVTGAAIASTISTYIGFIIFLSYALLPAYRRGYTLFRLKNAEFKLVRNVWGLAWPVALRMLLVHLSITMFLKMMGMVGTAELAATNIVFAIASLAWMPGYGFGVAAAALIGQNLGAGKPDEAERYGWESVKVGLVVMGAIGILFFIMPRAFMWLFTNDPEVIELGSKALRILAGIQFIDAVGIILSESLEGAGMMRFVMIAEILVSWLYFVPSAYLLALKWHMGITGGWLSLAGYILIFAVIIGYKFRGGAWKTVKV